MWATTTISWVPLTLVVVGLVPVTLVLGYACLRLMTDQARARRDYLDAMAVERERIATTLDRIAGALGAVEGRLEKMTAVLLVMAHRSPDVAGGEAGSEPG